jgi:hypothetical protein
MKSRKIQPGAGVEVKPSHTRNERVLTLLIVSTVMLINLANGLVCMRKRKEFVLLPKKRKKDKGNAGVAIEILRGAANFNEANRERTSIVGIASAPYRSATPSVASLDSCRINDIHC